MAVDSFPSYGSTEAKQDVGNASLSSIDGKITNPLPVLGPLTDTQLRASAVSTSTSLLSASTVVSLYTDTVLATLISSVNSYLAGSSNKFHSVSFMTESTNFHAFITEFS